MPQVDCTTTLASNGSIGFVTEAKRKDDPLCEIQVMEDPYAEDRQDDAQADCWIGTETGCVSAFVFRLFWTK